MTLLWAMALLVAAAKNSAVRRAFVFTICRNDIFM
jgi:hypothetical protein